MYAMTLWRKWKTLTEENKHAPVLTFSYNEFLMSYSVSYPVYIFSNAAVVVVLMDTNFLQVKNIQLPMFFSWYGWQVGWNSYYGIRYTDSAEFASSSPLW